MSLPIVDLMSISYQKQYDEICYRLGNAEKHPERAVYVYFLAYRGLVDMARYRKEWEGEEWELAS